MNEYLKILVEIKEAGPWSQGDMANKIGISPITFSRLFTPNHKVSGKVLRKIKEFIAKEQNVNK